MKKRNRRDALRLVAALAVGRLGPANAAEQALDWPQRPIRIVVPVAAGGIIDLLARAVANALGPRLKTSLFIETHAGADHLIGIQFVSHADADGYTWLCASLPFTVNPSLRANPGYDPAEFRPLGLIATSPNVLVVPSSVPARSVAEFVALAKARPGALNYANPGNGSSNHLGMELLKSEAGIDVLSVLYKGQPPAITDLLAGRVQAMIISSSLIAQYVATGQLRALAVVGPERLPGLATVPTMKEAGFAGVDVVPWFGLLAPAKVPGPVVAKIVTELDAALRSKELQDDIVRIGATPYAPGNVEYFAQLIRSDLAKWPAVVRRAGIEKS